MKLRLDPIEIRAVEGWLGLSTAMSGHPDDRSKFYEFVLAVWRVRRRLLDLESHFFDEIMEVCGRMHGVTIDPSFVRDKLEQAGWILEFLDDLGDRDRLYLLQ